MNRDGLEFPEIATCVFTSPRAEVAELADAPS
jgi:hypothetical protein